MRMHPRERSETERAPEINKNDRNRIGSFLGFLGIVFKTLLSDVGDDVVS